MIPQKYIVRLVATLLAVTLIAQTWVVVAGQTVSSDASPTASPEAQHDDRAIAFYPEDTGFGTFITVELEAGDSVERTVILGNAGNVEQTLRTYAIPAGSGINGGFVLADHGVEKDGITDWVEYPDAEVTLAPGEGVSAVVSISVPADAGPGEYVTALAAEQANAFEVEGTDLFTQRVRWSVPILIVVPGERSPAFELGEAKLELFEGSVFATLEITNTGNVTVRPTGEVRLIDGDGETVGVAKVELGAVYTGTATTFLVGWENPPTSDQFSIEVVLSDEEGAARVNREYAGIVISDAGANDSVTGSSLKFDSAALMTSTDDQPPSLLMFRGAISNLGEPIKDARVSIVTYQDGEEVDRYPIMQAVTIQTGETPVEARYSLPGGFTEGTYTFEVTIEVGDAGTQTVLVTQSIDFEVVVGD